MLFRSLAAEQAGLTADLLAALSVDGPTELTLCPTEYLGTHPSGYLTELARSLPDEVSLMWTGPTVCSPTIAADDARAWRAATGNRPVILWDNTPVNDASMTHALHLGPYTGRDPDLADEVAGVLCNPMIQARSSLVQLGTAMEFLARPDDFDAADAWGQIGRAHV